ncbi:MAG: cohesin domain-containing protein [Methanophagales archaeon]|nr:cohesin domain-containing protein [Methanophagales archaeon]
MSKRRKDKIKGKGVLVRGAVVCIAVAAISISLISGLAAQGTGDTVNVTVNAPEYVEGSFDASIDVDSITEFNSGQFDLLFDSNVVNVTDVTDGSLDGETIPVSDWERLDNDTIRVILDVSGITGVSGSGNLATISFAVVGETGDKSVLDISSGLLVSTEAEAIPAEWIDDEVIVGPAPVKISVNAPEYVEGTFNASIDVDSITEFNSGQFDLLFDSSVVNVTDVTDGSLNGETIPVSDWERLDDDTIRVILDVSGIRGVNGSGNLATISFAVVGETGDKSVLDISSGLLVNTEAEAIPAEWIDDEVIVGP